MNLVWRSPKQFQGKPVMPIGMSWPIRLHSRAFPRESMETSERSNTRGLHLEFVCLRKVRQACDANAKAIRCLEFPSSLQPVYTRKVPCTRLGSSASRGAARMDVCRRIATKFEPTQACGQSLMDKLRFRETFCEVLGLQWGVLRAGTEAQHFLTRSLQQLYTVRILSRRLIDSTRLLPVVWKDESRKRADESW